MGDKTNLLWRRVVEVMLSAAVMSLGMVIPTQAQTLGWSVDVASRQLIEVISQIRACGQQIAISPTGRRFHLTSNVGLTPEYRIIDVVTREVVHQETGVWVSSPQFSSDSRIRYELRFTVGYPRTFSIKALDDESGSEIWQLMFPPGESAPLFAVGFDGLYVGVTLGTRSGHWYNDMELRRLNPTTGREVSRTGLNAVWGVDVIVTDIEVLHDQVLVTAYQEISGQRGVAGSGDEVLGRRDSTQACLLYVSEEKHAQDCAARAAT